MNRIVLGIAAAVAAVACHAEAPKSYIPQSGERVMIGDFEFVILSAGDYADMTNRVGKLETIAKRQWSIQHSTENGRIEWHGKRVSFEVDGENKVAVTTYEDGYRHITPLEVKKPKADGAKKARPVLPPPRPRNIPSGAWEMRQRLEKQRSAKPVEVSATFAPGGKLVKVEGGAK